MSRIRKMLYRIDWFASCTAVVVLIAFTASSHAQGPKKFKGTYGVSDVWFIDSDGVKHPIDDTISVPSASGKISFTTDNVVGFGHATDVWFRHYRELKAENTLAKPDQPPGAVTPEPISAPNEWGEFNVCLKLDGVGHNNTIAIWVRYENASAQVFYVRKYLPFRVQPAPGFARVLFSGKSVARGSTAALQYSKKIALHAFTTKIDGRPASDVQYVIFPNKKLPQNKIPVQPTKGAKRVSRIVFDRGITRQWPFLVDLPEAKPGVLNEHTIVLWAVYRTANTVQYRTFVYYVKGPGKTK